MEDLLNMWNSSLSNFSLFTEAPPFQHARGLSPVIVAGYFELIVCVVGVPANLLVLYLWTIIGRKGGENQMNIRVHNNNHWFILGVTLADLIFTAVHAPLVAVWWISGHAYGLGGCLFLIAVTHATTTASSINVLLLNVDKFLYLNRPLHYYNLVTRNRAIAALIIGWLLALTWASVFALGPFTDFGGHCSNVQVTRPLEYIIFALFFFILPITVSFWISVYIATISIRASKGVMLEYGAPSEMSPGSRRRSMVAMRLKTLAFIFTTTAWCTVTCLPYRFAYILNKANFVDYTNYIWLFYSLYIMMAMTAAGNPLITIFTQPHYRRQLVQSISLFKKKKASQSSSYIGMSPSNTNGSGMTTYKSTQSQ